MAQTRSRRPNHWFFALFAVVALCIIGRNMYQRHLDAALAVAVDKGNLTDVRSLLDRGANVDAPQHTMPLLALALTRIDAASALRMNAGNGSQITAPPVYPDAEAVACLLIAKQADLRLPHFLYRNGQQTITGYDAIGYIRAGCRLGSLPVLRGLLDKGVVPTPECLEAALQFQNASYADSPLKGFAETEASGKVNAAVVAENLRRRARRKEIIGQMVQMLREYGASPTLEQCVTLGDSAALKARLEAETSPQAAAGMASSLLSLAVYKDDRALVNLLLAHGADVNFHNQSHTPALCAAAANGNLKMVNLLLARGANVNVTDAPPLLSALHSKRPEIARLLLARGADPNASAGASESILLAAIRNMPEIAPDLLKRGVNVKADNGVTLRTLLQSRSIETTQRMALVKELLRRGVNVNPPWVSERAGYETGAIYYVESARRTMSVSSPLLNAACFAPECTDMLLQAGAKIGPEKQTILATLAKCGRADLFARTLALGANVNGMDEDGETPLTQAIMNAPAGVPFLVQRGANVNVVPRTQHTPLMLAVTRGNVGITRLLLSQGANVNLRPERGHTPLYWAQKHRQPEIITLLEQAGAKAE